MQLQPGHRIREGDRVGLGAGQQAKMGDRERTNTQGVAQRRPGLPA